MDNDSPLQRFKEFVSEILAVRKGDVQKAEADRRAAFPPKPPAKDEAGGGDEEPTE
jgi:hypothetical protein